MRPERCVTVTVTLYGQCLWCGRLDADSATRLAASRS